MFGLQPVVEQTQGLWLGSAEGLRLGLSLAFVLDLQRVSGQAEGLSFVFGLRLRELSGLVQGLSLELVWIFGFEQSGLGQVSLG